MRAVRAHTYGDPDVLSLDELPVPEPGSGEVRVRVHASSVNPIDAKIRAGGQRAVVRYTLPRTLGLDVSGVIDAVGPGVDAFAVGDEVWGSPSHTAGGCYADYAVIPARQLGAKPAALSHAEAAALPLVALTAWEALVVKAKLQPGERVLIHAGAGGVGHVAIQIAKAIGAEVITTCSTRNVAFVTELGADRVVDYTQEDYASVLEDLDVALDALGGDERDKTLGVLRRGGRMPCIVGGIPKFVAKHGPNLGLTCAVTDIARFTLRARMSRGVKVFQVVRRPSGRLMDELARLVEDGRLRPTIAATFGLDDVAEAHRGIETGRTRGKLVIAVSG